MSHGTEPIARDASVFPHVRPDNVTSLKQKADVLYGSQAGRCWRSLNVCAVDQSRRGRAARVATVLGSSCSSACDRRALSLVAVLGRVELHVGLVDRHAGIQPRASDTARCGLPRCGSKRTGWSAFPLQAKLVGRGASCCWAAVLLVHRAVGQRSIRLVQYAYRHHVVRIGPVVSGVGEHFGCWQFPC